MGFPFFQGLDPGVVAYFSVLPFFQGLFTINFVCLFVLVELIYTFSYLIQRIVISSYNKHNVKLIVK